MSPALRAGGARVRNGIKRRTSVVAEEYRRLRLSKHRAVLSHIADHEPGSGRFRGRSAFSCTCIAPC